MGSGIPKEFGTLSELLYHRYAVLSALHTCVAKGVRVENRLFFSVYHNRHKGFLSGELKVSPLTKDEKLKMTLPQCCVYCGTTKNLTIDHLLPTKKGGEDIPENYVWACSSCNSSKGARDVITWLQSKGRYPSIVVFRRYVKLVLLYAQKHNFMDCRLDELPANLPFDVEAIKNPDVLPISKAEIYVPPQTTD